MPGVGSGYGSLGNAKPKRSKSTRQVGASEVDGRGRDGGFQPTTVLAALRAFTTMDNREGRKMRVIFCIPLMLVGALGYALWYGSYIGLGFMNNVYLFTITVTTIGYSAPAACTENFHHTVMLIVYQWLCVLLAGAALAVTIAAVHEAAENSYNRLVLDGDTDEEDMHEAMERKVFTSGPWAADGVSQMVSSARRKASFFRTRLRHQCGQIVSVFFLGAAMIMAMEDWSFTTALLWSSETMTSIGYGSDEATTTPGKVFTCLYAVTATLIFARIVGLVSSYPRLELDILHLVDKLEDFGFSPDGPCDMDPEAVAALWPSDDANHKMEKHEFALRFLVSMGKIDADDINDACEAFDRLAKVAHQTGAAGAAAAGAASSIFGGADASAGPPNALTYGDAMTAVRLLRTKKTVDVV